MRALEAPTPAAASSRIFRLGDSLATSVAVERTLIRPACDGPPSPAQQKKGERGFRQYLAVTGASSLNL